MHFPRLLRQALFALALVPTLLAAAPTATPDDARRLDAAPQALALDSGEELIGVQAVYLIPGSPAAIRASRISGGDRALSTAFHDAGNGALGVDGRD